VSNNDQEHQTRHSTYASRDNMAKDVQTMIKDSTVEAKYNSDMENMTTVYTDLLMQKLCSYISRRENLVWNAGVTVGKGKGEKK
jgi:hypothetical protein